MTENVYAEGDNYVYEHGYLFNYATCKDTIGRARSTNIIIMNDTEYVLPGKSIGIAMFNYIDWKTAEKIWKTNFNNTQTAVIQSLSSEQHGISVDGKIDSDAKLKIEVLNDASDDETIAFNTDELGYFVMVSNDEESQTLPPAGDNKVNDNDKKVVSPVQTGDTSNIWLYIILSAMTGAVLIRECKRKIRED